MSLIDEIEISAVWKDSGIRLDPTTGAVLVSGVLSGTGEEISDDYTLEITARSGGTGTVTVSSSSKNNPYDSRVKTGVNFDDTTVYKDVIPGVSLVFDNAAVNGDDVVVSVGDYQGSFDASGVGAGVPSAGVQHRVTNDGTDSVVDCKATLLPQVVHIDKTGRVFEAVSPFAALGTEKVAGGGSTQTLPYAMSITGTAGSGGSKTATLRIDGVTVPSGHILDLTLGTTSGGAGLKAISPGYYYKFVDGPLEGMQFALDAACVNSDVANILIFPSRYTQIAPDVAGVAGTYGTSDVDLTETGEATGVITASGQAFYWVRLLIPSSAGNESNPYPCNVALQASSAEAAGWLV